MTLYEIDSAILSCIDTETGEVLDFDMLSQLKMDRDKKCEGAALAVKNYEAEAAAIKAEIAKLTERMKACEKKADGLRWWLSGALQGEKFSTAKCAVSFRRSERVDILDEDAIPAEYKVTKTTTAPDKDAIKKAIKNGIEVSGATVVTSENIQIK